PRWTARRPWPSRRRHRHIVQRLASLPFAGVEDLDAARRSVGARNAEHDLHQPGEHPVEAVDERHHHEHESEHHEGELHQLLSRRRDDLAKLCEDLTKEDGDALEEVRLLLTRGAAADDDLATPSVLNHRTHLNNLEMRQLFAGPQGGQESNLQPAVLETAALPIE